MMVNLALKNGEKTGVGTAAMSLLLSTIAASTCMLPFVGILLGISGLGWLTRYSALTTPLSVAALTLSALATWLFRQRRSSCINRNKRIFNQNLLMLTILMAIAVNIVEHLVLPNLA